MSDQITDDERAAKRARTDTPAARPAPAIGVGDAMAATRAQLARTTDPHLQAQLLLQYSSEAIAPAAPTEAAIDFLFAFLQQSQSNGASTGSDQTKSPPSAESAPSSNAVVVAAIVRGLRALLAVKSHLVEPMIQLDAMGEQLTQCVSVPEDFKLRRDMLRIVLDCLVAARKFRETQLLLRACLGDHDDGLRTACLEGYERVIAAGHRLDDTSGRELVERLRDALLAGDDERTRVGSVRLLGVIADASFETPSSSAPALQDRILNTLASCVRDPSPRVRLQVAMAFRGFRNAPSPDSLYGSLLFKKQINEDLAEINTQSTAMLTSGALLTLLEDDHMDVAIATSCTMRALCDAALWTSDLIDRAVSTHIELAARVGNHEEQVVEVLRNLASFLARWDAVNKAPYSVSREGLSYLLGSLSTTNVTVTLESLAALRFMSIDTPHAASRIVQFLTSCSKSKSTKPTNSALVESLSSSTEYLVHKWVEQCVVLPVDIMASLRSAASTSHVNFITPVCQLIHNALCRPADRLIQAHAIPPTIRAPTFLDGF